MTTARDISDACDHKPLGKFGSKSVQRVVIRPVSTLPAATSLPQPAQPDPLDVAAGQTGEGN